MTDAKNNLRQIPSVDAVLELSGAEEQIHRCGRQAKVAAIRRVLDGMRSAIKQGEKVSKKESEPGAVLAEAVGLMAEESRPNIQRVINATGIVLHTGLGRAVMPDCASEAVADMTGSCNVQMDLKTGARIKREAAISDLVRELTGAEEVLFVNNNVGATLLILRALAQDREVIVSRGELIEIGGSFRLPDTMTESGAILREVGTTNKTHPYDYKNAISEDTGLILKVHKSNYKIVGFTEEVGIEKLAAIGKERDVVVVDDLGCGALVGLEQFGMEHEMTVRESLDAGADIVFFSTDKLIGGPQGGMIVGRKDLLDRIRAHSLYRALRVCKMTLAALESTLRLFKAPELLAKTHATYAMISKTVPELKKQAVRLAKRIGEKRQDWDVEATEGVSYLGGGSLPGTEMPSFAVKIRSGSQSADDIAGEFRGASVPVITRIKDDAVLLDMRTVFARESDDVVAACEKDAVEDPCVRTAE